MPRVLTVQNFAKISRAPIWSNRNLEATGDTELQKLPKGNKTLDPQRISQTKRRFLNAIQRERGTGAYNHVVNRINSEPALTTRTVRWALRTTQQQQRTQAAVNQRLARLNVYDFEDSATNACSGIMLLDQSKAKIKTTCNLWGIALRFSRRNREQAAFAKEKFLEAYRREFGVEPALKLQEDLQNETALTRNFIKNAISEGEVYYNKIQRESQAHAELVASGEIYRGSIQQQATRFTELKTGDSESIDQSFHGQYRAVSEQLKFRHSLSSLNYHELSEQIRRSIIHKNPTSCTALRYADARRLTRETIQAYIESRQAILNALEGQDIKADEKEFLTIYFLKMKDSHLAEQGTAAHIEQARTLFEKILSTKMESGEHAFVVEYLLHNEKSYTNPGGIELRASSSPKSVHDLVGKKKETPSDIYHFVKDAELVPKTQIEQVLHIVIKHQINSILKLEQLLKFSEHGKALIQALNHSRGDIETTYQAFHQFYYQFQTYIKPYRDSLRSPMEGIPAHLGAQDVKDFIDAAITLAVGDPNWGAKEDEESGRNQFFDTPMGREIAYVQTLRFDFQSDNMDDYAYLAFNQSVIEVLAEHAGFNMTELLGRTEPSPHTENIFAQVKGIGPYLQEQARIKELAA